MNDTFLRALRRETTEYTPVWVMRQAGAGNNFLYNAAHSYYIYRGHQDRQGGKWGALFHAYKPSEYAPQVGQSLHEMIGRVVQTSGSKEKHRKSVHPNPPGQSPSPSHSRSRHAPVGSSQNSSSKHAASSPQ